MKEKTKKKSAGAIHEPTVVETMDVAEVRPYSQLSHDLKSALLIVSVLANLFILTGWIALQVTSQFDSQVSTFLFTR